MVQALTIRKALTWCWKGVAAAGYAVATVTSSAGALYALYVAIVGAMFFRSLFPLAALVPATLNLRYLSLVAAITTGRFRNVRVFAPHVALPILTLLPLEVAGNWWFYSLWWGI